MEKDLAKLKELEPGRVKAIKRLGQVEPVFHKLPERIR